MYNVYNDFVIDNTRTYIENMDRAEYNELLHELDRVVFLNYKKDCDNQRASIFIFNENYMDPQKTKLLRQRISTGKLEKIDCYGYEYRGFKDFPCYLDTEYDIECNVINHSKNNYCYGIEYFVVGVTKNFYTDKNTGECKYVDLVTIRTRSSEIVKSLFEFSKDPDDIYDPYYQSIYNAACIGDMNVNRWYDELIRWFIAVRRCYDKNYWQYKYFGGAGIRMPDWYCLGSGNDTKAFGPMWVFKNYVSLTKFARTHGMLYTQNHDRGKTGAFVEPNQACLYCQPNKVFSRQDICTLASFKTVVKTNKPFAQNVSLLMKPLDANPRYESKHPGRPKGSTKKNKSKEELYSITNEPKDPWDVWKY